MTKPIIIGIAGGACSGKSTVSQIIANKLNTNSVTILHEKGYYKNSNQAPTLEKKENNFDHPNVFNNYLLIQQLKELINGKTVREPFFSYHIHKRLHRSRIKHPAKVIIVEGILALYDERLRRLMNIKMYVDAASDIMLIRRLRRDVKDWHLDLNKVFNNYVSTVRPMFQQFVQPTKRYADIIIPEDWDKNSIAIKIVVDEINSWLRKKN